MTVLDTSVAHCPVLMVLGPHEPVGPAALPEGYHLEPWDPRFREPWLRLHVALGQLPSLDEGLAYFDRTYAVHPEALALQMLVACDAAGNLVGTSSVWPGDHFGEKRLRVHWVGVDPAHQRRGLARVLVLHTIRLYDRLVPGGEPALYLATQTESWAAVSLYYQLGFAAYRGPKPPNFSACAETFAEDNERAWRIIDEKIAEVRRLRA